MKQEINNKIKYLQIYNHDLISIPKATDEERLSLFYTPKMDEFNSEQKDVVPNDYTQFMVQGKHKKSP